MECDHCSEIIMEPNVMLSDIEEYNHSINVSKPWVNMASIKGGSSIEKNRLALQALQQGANGLSIEMSNSDSIDEILKDILTSYLDVRIDCNQLTKEAVKTQKSLINENDFPNVRWMHQNTERKHFLISEDNRVQEIKECLDIISHNVQADIIVTLSKNLIFEIASLRAIRALVGEVEIESFSILARYDVAGTNELGDYNLIEKTYKVISGVLGGADAILTPYTGDEDSRLTLNIHNVLDLESGMKNVLDPLGGSYYIEKLTGEIISKVRNFSS